MIIIIIIIIIKTCYFNGAVGLLKQDGTHLTTTKVFFFFNKIKKQPKA